MAGVPKNEGPVSECAISFQHHFLHRSRVLGGAVIGPRRGTEATTPCPVPEYCKIGAFAVSALFCLLFRRFSVGKAESTDFCEAKFRCFAPKVRMFLPEKSGVLPFP